MPWRFFVTRIARAYGFLDPIQFISRLRQLAQPSEVGEPVELLRAGVLFHARGLINTKTIQNNLDWVWPYWVERQFNPNDLSFIPRAFSFSHINLTHRNWTAVGLPDVPFYPIVDPRGLVTPLYDGWSLDFWLVGDAKPLLLPSKLDDAHQVQCMREGLAVRSVFSQGDCTLETEVTMALVDHHPHAVIRVSGRAPEGSRLAVVVRPYNPEGISFVESIQVEKKAFQWLVNDKDRVLFPRAPEQAYFSTYKEGDVLHSLFKPSENSSGVECPASLASGAALFSTGRLESEPLEIHVPVLDEFALLREPYYGAVPSWTEERAQFSRLQVPDERFRYLYDAALTSLILHSPEDVYPGPYTYKRFWFRDAAFIINAMISLGAKDRSMRALKRFPERQTRAGYFLSQDGEWDSNGEAIWILHRYLRLTGENPSERWLRSVEKAAWWIIRKRLPKDLPEAHAGLLPAGFSAEHLGPNDYYYWDNFWGVAGLRCAAELLEPTRPEVASRFRREGEDFLATIVASFRRIPDRQARGAISASPHRRMDAGAIGSVVADFPLQLFEPGEPRLMQTVEFLLAHSAFNGGFFQNMIHSGINPYLTLHLAQVLLRTGDARSLQLIDTVADLASTTGHWPEAVHPQTWGGCMGDGQHVWAAAEWALVLRNLFVREEVDRLVLGSGLFPRWLAAGEPLVFGPTLTPFGKVTVRLEPREGDAFELQLDGEWRGARPIVEARVPGYAPWGLIGADDRLVLRPA